ncbi:hypothetical protein HPDFL43_00029350 [Hoeflea phototrophica DFL-43]|uniref:Uncharacterized protein n=1 Tax=Hoeflea phototrophica (strain DSM 17068 / NCIMB 14078 / DFL-43) TaxID=411684 RepID=A0A095BDZ1_HOEPD|nr:hypothetical protein HPDFL43_00029350 [Hoeflea phototrophica DFL-43]
MGSEAVKLCLGKDPSPTPPHKGEGLGSVQLAPAETSITTAKSGLLDAMVRPGSPSPLWGGVGEGTSFAPNSMPRGT